MSSGAEIEYVTDEPDDAYRDLDRCEGCGDGDAPTRAIKMREGRRLLLCIECFGVAYRDEMVSPKDPRVNDDGSIEVGVPSAPGQTRPNEEVRD